MTPYYTNAQSYLDRARMLLKSEDKTSLMYAALELRKCIEARQMEYASALDALKGQKLKPWNIDRVQAKLVGANAAGSIAHLTIESSEGRIECFFVPVTEKLARAATRLGEYLHHREEFDPSNEQTWVEMRSFVVDTYRQAWLCCQGNMTTPLLMGEGNKMHPISLFVSDNEKMKRLLTVGKELAIEVRYLDKTPQEWMCDI